MLSVHDSLQLFLSHDGFKTRIYNGNLWLPETSVASTALGRLAPSVIDEEGFSGSGDGFTWRTTFTPFGGGVWVETHLNAERAIYLNPTMIVWLGALDNLNDRQAHTWRQTTLRAPTVNANGLGGNDLPAGYLYDHATHTETMCYFPPNAFAWAAHRFYEFGVREVLRYRPEPRYGIGLVGITPEVDCELPPGEHRFAWWFTQRYRADIPTPWQAQARLIEVVTPLLDTQPTLIPEALSWSVMAKHTLEDLAHPDCWTSADGVEGLRAYVRGSSAVNRDQHPFFELMTQLDVLHPLLMWARMTDQSVAAQPIIDRLLRTLPHFDRPEWGFVANNFPQHPNDSFMDTWYFLENALIKLPWVAYLTGDEQLKAMFMRALEGARELFGNSAYLPPLFADARDWKARGSLQNLSVGGLYAAGCVIGFQLTGERLWVDEAARTLRTLHGLPPHLLTHEPQQLSFGAAAAGYLARRDDINHEQWRTLADDLVRLSLRMGYWAADPAVPHYDPRGMFQACASLCYPAYKENVETILPWAEHLRHADADAPLTDLMAAWMNLGRCHNYAFFDPYLPPEVRRGSCAYIPYEDLATAEFTHTAHLGKELYGAGEVFWSALLFDTFGRVDAPDVLCLSLDIPTLDLTPPSANERRFLLYNPAPSARDLVLTTTIGSQPVTLMPRAAQSITCSPS